MFRKILKKRGRVNIDSEISPDEIFLDSQNLADFDTDQLEGRIEKPVSRSSILLMSLTFFLLFGFLVYKIFNLQVVSGEDLRAMSENNNLRHSVIFAARGNIYDRNGELLAWNQPVDEEEYPKRIYIENGGFGNLIGYVKYPQKDKQGFYYELNYQGVDGLEKYFNDILSGENGTKIVETNAIGETISTNTIYTPEQGESVDLTIDAGVQAKLFDSIKNIADNIGYEGGSGIIIDVTNGEVIALTTYPEISSKKLTEGDKEYLQSLNEDFRNPFLNRVTQGLYAPGSIMKPFIGVAALNENVIAPTTKIVSRGELEVPNPYDPDNPTYFSDFQAYGPVDIKEALAVSSNIYFYVVGGGYEDIDGLGISRIEEYMRKFGFGSSVEGQISSQLQGTVPNPEWKAETFDGDIWRLGDTYFTSIGQYGFQITPLQAVLGISAIANDGKVFQPKILKESDSEILREIEGVDESSYQIVREGMRMAITDGRAQSLNFDFVDVAVKTGTAEIGARKEKINSSLIGFFPYENPKYAFAVVMERGSAERLVGGVAVMREVFLWMNENSPKYFGS